MKKRAISALLTAVLLVGLLSAGITAMAEGDGETATHFVDGGPYSYITISNVANENVLTIREIIDAYNIAEADMRDLFPPWSDDESNWNSQNVSFYACTAPVRLELIDGFLTGFACLSGTTQMEAVVEDLRMGIPTEYGPYVPNNAVLVGSYIILNASGLYRIEPRSYVMGPQPFMVLVTGDSAPVTEQPESPTEMPSDWAQEYIDSAIENGLLPQNLRSGYAQAITRAEYCSLAVTLYETVMEEITERVSFLDTDDVNVEKAAAIGVVRGVNAEMTLFDPDALLTREQAATMLSRLAEAMGIDLPNHEATFIDMATVSDYAVIPVGQMQASGIMTGYSYDIFAPQGPYTREQSVTTIVRMFNIAGE